MLRPWSHRHASRQSPCPPFVCLHRKSNRRHDHISRFCTSHMLRSHHNFLGVSTNVVHWRCALHDASSVGELAGSLYAMESHEIRSAQTLLAGFRPPFTNRPLLASAVLARLRGLGNDGARHVTQDLTCRQHREHPSLSAHTDSLASGESPAPLPTIAASASLPRACSSFRTHRNRARRAVRHSSVGSGGALKRSASRSQRASMAPCNRLRAHDASSTASGRSRGETETRLPSRSSRTKSPS